MSGTDIERIVPTVAGEVLDEPEYLRVIYDNLGVEAALEVCLDRNGVDGGETAADVLLGRFSAVIADVANKPGGIDLAAVRFGFDHLTDNMNGIASRKFGHQPQTSGQALLTRLGMNPPQPRQYVRPLDDRYWSQQFMDQYKTGGPMVTRQAGEPEDQYLARYIHSCIHGFLFAPFTLL